MARKGDIPQNESYKKQERIIDSVLDALNDEGIDAGLKKRMQAWFLRDFEDNPAKQEAFVRYAAKIEPYRGELQSDDLARYDKLVSRLGIHPTNTYDNIGPRNRRPFASRVRRVAAILLPAAAAAFFWLMPRSAEQDGFEITVAVSDMAQSAFLPDSSFVSVAPGSSVVYHDNADGSRSVELMGEAMFRVRKEGERSFLVATANMTVNVHGTDFAVSEFPGSPRGTVELYSGSVEVETDGVNTGLSRGETLSYDLATHDIGVSVIPASRMIERGYKPRLKFNRATFGEVMLALSAFHGIEIEINSELNTNAGSISGDIEGNTLESALRMILKMWGLNVAHRREGERIIIYRK